jgi:hypothetical protein
MQDDPTLVLSQIASALAFASTLAATGRCDFGP